MCEADYVFIREWPQKMDWPEKLCKNVVMVCIKYSVSNTSVMSFICFAHSGEKIRKKIEYYYNF